MDVELSWESGSPGSYTPVAQVEPCRRAREKFLWRACQAAFICCIILAVVYIIMALWVANVSCMRSQTTPGCPGALKVKIEKHKEKCPDFPRRTSNMLLVIG